MLYLPESFWEIYPTTNAALKPPMFDEEHKELANWSVELFNEKRPEPKE